jgi:hypothetical protein
VIPSIRRTAANVSIFGLALSLSGCAVQFLSGYDATTDQIATAMQKAHTDHVLTIVDGQKPACLYGNNKNYYRSARVDASALAIRVAAIPKNDPTIGQVDALKGALDSFERLDQLAARRNICLSGEELAPIDRGMNSIFGAILKLEFAKLRGARRP